jgi:hypothetical protein
MAAAAIRWSFSQLLRPRGLAQRGRIGAQRNRLLCGHGSVPPDLVQSEGMAATTIVVSGSNPVLASSPAPSPRRFGGRERPSYADRYRSDYGQASNNYYWRPEPRFFPFFNSY